MELLVLPFLTSPPSFAPSLPCQISALHFQGSQEQGWRHLWSPCSSLLIDLCHYPSNPPARSSCLQHYSPLSQELWIYPAKAQGNNCLFAAQAFEIPGENEISLALDPGVLPLLCWVYFQIPTAPAQLPNTSRELPVAFL